MNKQQTTDLEPEIIELINTGNTIEAIKMLRELRNIGLKESKDIVDSYRDGTLEQGACEETKGPEVSHNASSATGQSEPTTHQGINKRSSSTNKVIFMAVGIFIVFMIYKQFTQ